MDLYKELQVIILEWDIECTKLLNEMTIDQYFYEDKKTGSKGPISSVLSSIANLIDSLLEKIGIGVKDKESDLHRPLKIDFDVEAKNKELHGAMQEAGQIFSQAESGGKIPEGKVNRLITKLYNIAGEKPRAIINRYITIPALQNQLKLAKSDLAYVIEQEGKVDSLTGQMSEDMNKLLGAVKNAYGSVASGISRIFKVN